MKLPPKRHRSIRGRSSKRKTILLAGGHVLPNRSVSYPEIYVAVGRSIYGQLEFAKCQVKVKRKLYRYLVWKHEGKQHSFYMGRAKIPAPLSSAGGRRAAPGPRSGSQRGTRKKAEFARMLADQDGEE